MNSIPIRLKKEHLIGAIWQVQFDSPAAGDALPRLLYASLRKQYPEVRLQRLPAASILPIVAGTEPSVQLAAKVRLDAPQAAFIWQIGDRVATVSCRKPYAGWSRFKACILDLIQTMEESGLVPSPQRHSLRYMDLLALDEASDLSALPLETLSRENAVSWSQVRDQLDLLHDRSKRLFLEHLLTDQALTTAGANVVRGIDSLGWTPAETLETYLRLQPFAEDWSVPGMEVYDAL